MVVFGFFGFLWFVGVATVDYSYEEMEKNNMENIGRSVLIGDSNLEGSVVGVCTNPPTCYYVQTKDNKTWEIEKDEIIWGVKK